MVIIIYFCCKGATFRESVVEYSREKVAFVSAQGRFVPLVLVDKGQDALTF